MVEMNSKGETFLLCFSDEIAKMAERYSNQHNTTNLNICVENFFTIPFNDRYFDAVFANCFFDFCQEKDFNMITLEIQRVLKDKGKIFSVYMDFPSSIAGKIWNFVFNKITFLSQGCHPVDIRPVLSKHNFNYKKDISLKRFGFPIKYIQAVKQKKSDCI